MDPHQNRLSLTGMAVLVLSLFMPAPTLADWAPVKNVEIVIGSGPGGGNDRAGRTVQRLLGDLKIIGTTVSVVNKPGAGGFIGWTYLNQHGSDGHAISTSTPNLLTTHIVGRSRFSYSAITPIAQLYSESGVFVVGADSRFKSAKDLIEAIKSDPESFSTTVGTSAGNHNHIALGMLARAVGADPRRLKVVVFKSSSEATTAVLGGHVDMAIVAASSRRKHVESGKMRALAVAAPQRLGGPYANVPTWKEAGANVISAFWVGIIGSRELKPDQVRFWNGAFASLARSKEWKTYLERFSLEDSYMGHDKSLEFLKNQYQEYKGILTDLGLAKSAN